MKCWEVLEKLHNWRLLKKGSAPWVSEDAHLSPLIVMEWVELALIPVFSGIQTLRFKFLLEKCQENEKLKFLEECLQH
jgi:hypothetical protein